MFLLERLRNKGVLSVRRRVRMGAGRVRIRRQGRGTCGFSERVVPTFGVPVMVDKTIGMIAPGEYDALAIPGGSENYGFYEEAFDDRFLDLIRESDRRGKLYSGHLRRRPAGREERRPCRKESYYLPPERRRASAVRAAMGY